MRSINDQNESCLSFITASSRIIPKSTPTIPRLELCAAVDLAQQSKELSHKLNIPSSSVFLYTDSTIVLGYLANINKRFSRYVTRRVDTILEHSELNQWHYVKTDDNPGDIASRRQSIESLNKFFLAVWSSISFVQ